MPDRDLTASEIETMLKQDVLPVVTLQRCGRRFIDWYENVRKGWQ